MPLDKALLCKGTAQHQPLPSRTDVVSMLEHMRNMLSDNHMRDAQRRLNSTFWFPRYIFNTLPIFPVCNFLQFLVELPAFKILGRRQTCAATCIDKVAKIEFPKLTSLRGQLAGIRSPRFATFFGTQGWSFGPDIIRESCRVGIFWECARGCGCEMMLVFAEGLVEVEIGRWTSGFCFQSRDRTWVSGMGCRACDLRYVVRLELSRWNSILGAASWLSGFWSRCPCSVCILWIG